MNWRRKQWLVACCLIACTGLTHGRPVPGEDVAAEVKALRKAMAQQQEQIQSLQAKVEQLEKERVQQQAASEKATAEAQATAEQARKAADHAEFSAAEAKTAEILHADAAKTDQKKLSEADGQLKRFRLAGDIRVRYESILQDLTPTRQRFRLRARLGVEGKLDEDFTGGIFLATGTLGDDPVSTNQTLTSFFTRKTIGLDRAWITYQPLKHKWLQLTGGKWAATWLRTDLTFDPDLNPEGFSEKISFNLKNPVVKNLSLTGMQLMFNEVAGSFSPVVLGNDSFAAGGQGSVKLQLGKRVTTTLAGSALNWRNTDSIIKAVVGSKVLGGNRNTNATVGAGLNTVYASQFLYLDFIADTAVNTGWERFPLRLTLDFVDNPRAVSDQRQAFSTEIGFGQLKQKHDLQVAYTFARVQQDAVLAAFNESEFRAPTNVLQHRLRFDWMFQKNTTASVNAWIGRTLNRNLQNAALPPNLPPGEKDPYVKRLQFDVTYKF